MDLKDRELLARTLQAEAGNQGYNGLVAVGSVIMNRLAGGNDLGKVILQPGHFSAWNRTTGYAGGEQGQDMDFTPSARSYEVADALLAGNYEDPTGGATHYYNPQFADPIWGASGGGDWQTIGSHIFGKANGASAMNRQAITNPSALGVQTQPAGQPRQGLLGGQGIGSALGMSEDFRDKLKIAILSGSDPRGFAGQISSIQEGMQGRKAEAKDSERRNKTADFLQKISPDAAALMREGYLSPSDALRVANDNRMRAMAKSAGDAFRAGNMQEAMAILTEMSPTAMGQQIAAQAMKPPGEVIGGGKYTVTYPNGRSGEPVITVNEDVVAAERRIRQAELEEQRAAAGLPPDARKAEEEDFGAISSLDNIIQDIGGIVDDFGYNPETGEFTGPLSIGLGGLIAGAFGSIGLGGEGAVATAKAREEFDRFKTRLINESLRLNKGVQTEGDSQRAAAELGNAKSMPTAYAAIQELLKINQRARSAREAAIIRRRGRLNVSGVDVPAPPPAPDLGWRIK